MTFFEADEVVFPVPQAIRKPGWVRVCRSLCSANECRELVQFAEEHGRYHRSGGQRIKRDVHICYLEPEDAPAVFKKIARAFARHNVWGFALSGIVEPMRIQKYGIAGYTRPHSDYDYCTSDQSKITAIIPLVPSRTWSGGNLTVAGRRAQRIDRGDCLLFPSFALHSVSPVTRGERIVLSAWVAGPRLV
jgi:PKHD-type hydroxylase